MIDKGICLISFRKLSKGFPAFTFAGAIDNLGNIYFSVNILSRSPYVGFNENDPLLKALRANYRPSSRVFTSPKVSLFHP